MLRKAISVLPLEPQTDSGEMGMLRKSIFMLPLEPQPDSAGLRTLHPSKARKSLLSLEPQPDSAGLRTLRVPQGPERIFEKRCTSLNPWHSHGLFLLNLTVLASLFWSPIRNKYVCSATRKGANRSEEVEMKCSTKKTKEFSYCWF